MTKAQRKHLEKRLLEERERVLRLLDRFRETSSAEEREQSGDLSAFPLHFADEGTDTEDQDTETVLAQRQSATLADIDDALRRLYREPDSFGRCVVDGREIPFARLDIIPWARTCPEHQQTRE
ncbi:MAG TPA: TraR/DksA C4-type zinc finger protein [Gemmatimonadaceae bacterium]